VAPIRILLVAMPRLMRDIVTAELLAQPDMKLIGVCDTSVGLVDEIRDGAPDFVLIGAEHGCSVQALFEERPWMRVLEIEPLGADAHLYELRPRRVDLGPMSAAELVTTICNAARAPRWAEEGP
jgi:DNA-binding NarL/FixJ family response regulator